MYKDITCPYCDHDFNLYDMDGYYQEDHGVETECPNCDKNFMVFCSMSWSYDSHKADCLNGADHKWQAMHGAPKEYFEGRERCTWCDDERKVAV